MSMAAMWAASWHVSSHFHEWDNRIQFNEAAPGTDAFDMYVVKLDGTGLARVTNNNLYDGFSVLWMNWNENTASARAYQAQSPRQMRLEHRKMLLQHRKRIAREH